jgi:hypothetical protein
MNRRTNFKNVSQIDRELQIHDFHVDGNINPLREIREKEYGKLEENILENVFFRSSGGVIQITSEKTFIDQNKKRLRKEKRKTKAMGNRQKRRRENREVLVEE